MDVQASMLVIVGFIWMQEIAFVLFAKSETSLVN